MLDELKSYYYLNKDFINECKQGLYTIIIQYIYEKALILNSKDLKVFIDNIKKFVLLKFEKNNKNYKSALVNIG